MFTNLILIQKQVWTRFNFCQFKYSVTCVNDQISKRLTRVVDPDPANVFFFQKNVENREKYSKQALIKFIDLEPCVFPIKISKRRMTGRQFVDTPCGHDSPEVNTTTGRGQSWLALTAARRVQSISTRNGDEISKRTQYAN